jgi:radical SAM superfamily enzyme YgiQ (UPF0313 family)
LSSFDGILPHVLRPSRYIDGELNLASPGFREGGFNVLIVFPDIYEIGMSHQGIRFLYTRLAHMENVGVEFAFAPWPDMEDLMRSCGEPLRSWQTRTEARRFDCIGFSLTYELHYTNMISLLELAGLDIEASRRDESAPVVVAGGPCCSNPLPFIEMVDAVFLGDAEESLPEAVSAMQVLKESGAGRKAQREALAGIEGIFVDGTTPSARYRVYRFGETDLPRAPIVPSASIVHDRLAVEIMRGCTRGCRFCHAGVIYRPRRERSVGEIVDAVCTGLGASGWGEVSLLSLSSSDYSCLDELLERLAPELERRRVSLALPSLRPETITDGIVRATSSLRKSGFTLAPEAGTERLRRVINKGMSDEAILEGCRKIVAAGWQTLKLYFMIGLPTESEEDLDGIAGLVENVLRLPRGRFKLAVSISPFVPKPHTPFQWERQCSIEEIEEKEAYLASRIKRRRVQLSMRDPKVSLLEGVMSRGDRRLWPVLRAAHRLGCRFDSWRNRFRFDLWERAFAENGLDYTDLTGRLPLDAELPWSPFEPRVAVRHLVRERERALEAALTPDCREGGCAGCGACDAVSGAQTGIAAQTGSSRGKAEGPRRRAGGGAESGGTHVRYRFLFQKRGRERFLSHLETLGVIQRALRRSELPVQYTGGFNPHPRLSMGPSLPVGFEGIREFFDVELSSPADVSPSDFEGLLPGGIGVIDVRGPFARTSAKLPPEARYRYLIRFDHLVSALAAAREDHKQLSGESEVWYRLMERLGPIGWRETVSDGSSRGPARLLHARLEELIDSGRAVTDRRGRVRTSTGCTVHLSGTGEALELTVPAGRGGSLRPKDVIGSVVDPVLAELLHYTRTEILYKKGDRYIDPIVLIEENQRG